VVINTKTLRIAIALFVAFVLVTFIFTSVRDDRKPVNQVDSEDVQCISAICTNSGTYGQSCSEFKPKIAHIYQTTDVNEPGAHRLVINLNDNSCKG